MNRRSKNPRFSATVARQRSSGHAADRSRYPRLHADDLDNYSAVLGAVDGLLIANDNYKLMSAGILEAQDRLQALCDEDAWIAFLDVEAAFNDRVNFMMAIVARWAFNEGRRHQRHRGRR